MSSTVKRLARDPIAASVHWEEARLRPPLRRHATVPDVPVPMLMSILGFGADDLWDLILDPDGS